MERKRISELFLFKLSLLLQFLAKKLQFFVILTDFIFITFFANKQDFIKIE